MLQLWIVLLLLVKKTIGDTAYLEDTNNDHDKRNLYFGLPETLSFRLNHGSGVTNINLQENKRLNAIYAPLLVSGDDDGPTTDGRAVEVELPPNNRVKFYQDRQNRAFFTGECVFTQDSPCTRQLTGNIVIEGQEYTLEPRDAAPVMARGFTPHLGTPYSLVALEDETSTIGGQLGNDTAGDENLCFVIPDEEERKQHEADYVTDDVVVTRAKEEALLRTLLEKLRSLEKRSTPTAHGVEMLLAIDHVIYDRFIEVYPRRLDALYAIRQYYSHIINGVDLRYATIQRDDVSFYVTLAAIFVAKTKNASSVWMDYTVSPTDGMMGLKNMRTWRRDTPGLPTHDHAALITGTNIAAGGKASPAGIAYVRGVCGFYGVSINEEKGFFKGSGILAHELGHNLGASHDGGNTGCPADQRNVMMPYVPSVSSTSTSVNPWRFSNCSVNSFSNYLSGLGERDCTLNAGKVYDENEFNLHTASLAGKLYTEDQQCELLMGTGATMCHPELKDTSDICRDFKCRPAGSTSDSDCKRYVPAHGTSCGTDMMCFEGLCQEDACVGRDCDGGVTTTTTDMTSTSTEIPTTTTTMPSYSCIDEDVYGHPCSEMLSFLGYKKMCNKFGAMCCKTCTNPKSCRGDMLVKLRKKKYSCSELVDMFTLPIACRLFTRECCVKCSAAVKSRGYTW